MCEVFILSELFVAKTDNLNGNLVVREAFTMRSVRVLSQNWRKGRGGEIVAVKAWKEQEEREFFLGGLGGLGFSRRTRDTSFS